MPPSSRLIWYESASPYDTKLSYIRLMKFGWSSRLVVKIVEIASRCASMVSVNVWYFSLLVTTPLQPVMKCNQPYTAERRNMLGNMSPRNRRFAKTGTLHPEARHIVCQLSVIDNWVVSRCICPLISGLSFEEMCSIHKYHLRGIILMINTSSQE